MRASTLYLFLSLTLSLTLSTLPAPAQDMVAVRAGRIITMSGPSIDNGTILVRNGKIVTQTFAGKISPKS